MFINNMSTCDYRTWRVDIIDHLCFKIRAYTLEIAAEAVPDARGHQQTHHQRGGVADVVARQTCRRGAARTALFGARSAKLLRAWKVLVFEVIVEAMMNSVNECVRVKLDEFCWLIPQSAHPTHIQCRVPRIPTPSNTSTLLSLVL